MASVVLMCGGAAGAAGQRSDTATMHVSMEVVPSCTVSATAVEFGDYDPLTQHATQPLDAEATVTAVCTPNTQVSLEMDNGLHASGTTRRLASGNEHLRYELFQDGSRARIWGSGSQALRLTTPANSIAPVVRTVFARIQPGQSVTAGDYADTIQVIMHF